jgi:molecular chaperone GrpE
MTERQPTKAELAEQVDELQALLADAEGKRDEYLDDLRRIAAEFENYRKRAARDQEALVARAHERLVKALLPVLDDLERAVEAAAKHEEAGGAELGRVVSDRARDGVVGVPLMEEGVALVERQLRETLAKEGLEEIPTNGRFDPHVHEALLSQPSEAEEGAILDVLQKGYRLGDRVLRPARVVVSQGVGETQAAE